MKTICLIGKPNVGKSSIFNRLIKEKKSIILSEPNITRDRIYGIVEYKGKKFNLIDTGGLHGSGDFDKDIYMQASLAIDEADTILFVTDGLDIISDSDKKIRNMLKKSGKDVIVLVNKIDNAKRMDNIYAFYELGFQQVLPISAEHNIGFKELLELLTKDIDVNIEEDNSDIVKFCFIGRPNVGKSSLINALLNEERAIVSDIAGTTRDAVDTHFTYDKKEYIMIDTAGMRKKGKIYEEIEKYSLLRSMKAINRSDVCVLVIDAETGIIEHDKHILSYAIDAGKGIVIAVNKWDTVKDPNEDLKRWKKELEVYFKFVPYINFVFVSAKTRKRLNTLMPEVIKAYENNRQEIKTSLLNDVITDAVSLHEPPSYKGKRLKIYFVSQTDIKPPKFTFNVNNKKLVHFSYERYLENKIREAFSLEGTPIILKFKNRSDK